MTKIHIRVRIRRRTERCQESGQHTHIRLRMHPQLETGSHTHPTPAIGQRNINNYFTRLLKMLRIKYP